MRDFWPAATQNARIDLTVLVIPMAAGNTADSVQTIVNDRQQFRLRDSSADLPRKIPRAPEQGSILNISIK